ncbi:hypothetical protein E4K10_06985 [Streptomyces sp. T1317-0309]|nr:hypothetical protein E4K10_06985 [Streptomyces sp. T1317-0309]
MVWRSWSSGSAPLPCVLSRESGGDGVFESGEFGDLYGPVSSTLAVPGQTPRRRLTSSLRYRP